MFSGSSAPRRIGNADGTTNVYCFTCGEFICQTFMGFTSAQCEMCRRTENGEKITNEAVREYEQLKMQHSNVSLLVLPEEQKGPRFTLGSMVSNVLTAVGFKKQTNQTQVMPSARLAKEKKRGRLFESVDLGSITDVDQQLKPK